MQRSSEAGQSQGGFCVLSFAFWVLSNSFEKGIQAGVRQPTQNAKRKTLLEPSLTFMTLLAIFL
jgi:hypothetical protein